MIWQSCGQQHLLQPYIPDMRYNEYRFVEQQVHATNKGFIPLYLHLTWWAGCARQDLSLMLANPSSADCAAIYHGQTVYSQLQPKCQPACRMQQSHNYLILCRMYMFGTDAKGLPNDTAAVLTAFTYGRELNLLGQVGPGKLGRNPCRISHKAFMTVWVTSGTRLCRTASSPGPP